MSNLHSTDIDRENFELKDSPQESRALLVMVISALLIGVIVPTLVILYADRIDAFLNTLFGAITLVCIFGAVGIWWLIYRIKNMF